MQCYWSGAVSNRPLLGYQAQEGGQDMAAEPAAVSTPLLSLSSLLPPYSACSLPSPVPRMLTASQWWRSISWSSLQHSGRKASCKHVLQTCFIFTTHTHWYCRGQDWAPKYFTWTSMKELHGGRNRWVAFRWCYNSTEEQCSLDAVLLRLGSYVITRALFSFASIEAYSQRSCLLQILLHGFKVLKVV